ncbi:chaperonin 10-like protein [Aspergillus sergii]|uniref:Chaperonin 10-like protein n=1 Tax=Aspergillus sergii TaxID=1034303 RepID=A0A5N6XDW9_9EURO|nr:chaperonin 10-like protein [Aspergillus sergii]
MKAALWYGPEKGLIIGEKEKPKPGNNQVLVRVKCSSLCHSDLSLFSGQQPPESLPVVPGHEATGYVESVGSNVTNVKVGDAVGFLLYTGYCGSCAGCEATPLACPSNRVQGFTADGYFAEYVVTDSRATIKLPDGMDIVAAAPLFCAGLTAFHGIDKCNLNPGEYVGIVGVGGLGHLAVQYAVKMGLKPVAFDVDDSRLLHARSLGAVATFNVKDPELREKVQAETGGGVHAACVFSGAMSAYSSAQQTLRFGGLLMVVGLPNGTMPITAMSLAMGLMRVQGASSGLPKEMERAIAFSHKHNIFPKIEQHKLEDLPKLVERLEKGQFEGRMVVVF